MLPLYDLRALSRIPYITYGLIAANMLVFAWQMLLAPLNLSPFFSEYGLVPSQLFGGGPLAALLSSLFIHGSWLHLAGNMLYLSIFGDDVEDILGPGPFLFFYLLCGVLGMLAQAIVMPNSNIPIIGASGAIAGLLGAYAYRLRYTSIVALTLRYIVMRQLEYISATWVILIWLVLQVIVALTDLGGLSSGVAVFAHLGGFAGGYGLIHLYTRLNPDIIEVQRRPPGERPSSPRSPFRTSPPPARPSPGGPSRFGPRPSASDDLPDRPRGAFFRGRSSGQDSEADNEDDRPLAGGLSRNIGSEDPVGRLPSRPAPPPAADDSAPAENLRPSAADLSEELKAAEAKLSELRGKISSFSPATEEPKPAPKAARADFSGLNLFDHRAKAMNFFTPRRGEVVQLELSGGREMKGTVVSLSGKQLMLRHEDGSTIWIPLQEILRVL
jgi:membrane associated rhomboid family serine protease